MVVPGNSTYIDAVSLIAQKEVVHDGSFMQLRQGGHVLNAMDAARVHRAHCLPVQFCSLQVDHLQNTQTCPQTFHDPVMINM